MTDELCVICRDRPAHGAYGCVPCLDRARQVLAESADMAGAARGVATRQARHGAQGGSGKPGSALPLDLGATARLDAVNNTLTTWARHIAETRGVPLPDLETR